MRDELDRDNIALPDTGWAPVQFLDSFPLTPDRKAHLLPEALDREAALIDELLARRCEGLLVATADALARPADSLAVPESTLLPKPFQLDALYARIQQHYPETPHAEQARRLLAVLEENRPVPPPDTTAAVPDSLALPTDSLVTTLPDSLAAPADSPFDDQIVRLRIAAADAH